MDKGCAKLEAWIVLEEADFWRIIITYVHDLYAPTLLSLLSLAWAIREEAQLWLSGECDHLRFPFLAVSTRFKSVDEDRARLLRS